MGKRTAARPRKRESVEEAAFGRAGQRFQRGNVNVTPDEIDRLQQENIEQKRQIIELNRRLAETEKNAKSAASDAASDGPTVISESEETLKRLVQRTAMIVQAEKCVIIVRDRESGELYARTPAYGMTDMEIARYRVPAGEGISGKVYEDASSYTLHQVSADPLAEQERLSSFNVRNGVAVPLTIEKRDDENKIVERLHIGVLHCFNKRYGGDFIEEDVRLLERLSRNAAAVIANDQMFREVIEEKQKLVHTLESLTAGLLLINQYGRIGQMNAQARAIFGIEPSHNPIGKPFAEVIKNEDCLAIIRKRIENAEPVEGEEIKPDEITVTDADNTDYVYQMHCAQVSGDDNKDLGIVIIFNDITEIRAVEKMKTEFVSIVSHELRTPLTPMKGFVRTLLDDENEEWYMKEDRREFYEIIDQNVDRLGRLIDDLLNVSRIEKGVGLEMHWEKVDLRDAAEQVATMQRGRTDKHTISVDFTPEHIEADTDRDKIQNVLHNILSNAIKYSPDGGDITIIGRVEPAADEKPEMILVGVKDQGMGLTANDLKKVGEKFFRTETGNKARVSGTGIGLFLVKGIMAAHGGRIWPESDGLGKGTTFWCEFPRFRPEGGSDTTAIDTGG